MSDLISRRKAKEDLLSWAVVINKPNLLSREDALTVLDIIPAVDAVPVVRCKDCCHRDWEQNRETGKVETVCKHPSGLKNPGRDCSCSYGERKEE